MTGISEMFTNEKVAEVLVGFSCASADLNK